MIRPATPRDASRNLDIWREAVAATHGFVSQEDLIRIDALVEAWLPTADLWVHVDGSDEPLGFMALTDAHIDALFVEPARHGSGVGRRLIIHAARLNGALTVDVNEQNIGAVGFYERMGFERTGRSPLDGQGLPYPLLHMARRE